MRITESRVRQIIREEVRVINKAIKNEGFLDTVKGFFGGDKEDAPEKEVPVPYFASETNPNALSKKKIYGYIEKNDIDSKVFYHFENRISRGDVERLQGLAYAVIKKKYRDAVKPPPPQSVMKDMIALIIDEQTVEDTRVNRFSDHSLGAAWEKAMNRPPATWHDKDGMRF